MRNFKLFYQLAIIAITSFVIYSCTKDSEQFKPKAGAADIQLESRSSTDPCEGVGGQCTGPFTTYFESVTIAQFPNCTFEVEYKKRTCPVGKTDMQIVEWGPWPACQDFDNALDSVILANPNGVGLWIQKIEKKVLTALVTKLASQDPGIPNCGSLNQSSTYGYSQGSCIKFCLVKKISTKPGGLTLWKAVQIPCGDACCRTEYRVCKNPDGTLNIQVQNYSTQGVPGSCESQSPAIPCPKGTYLSTPCIPNCQAL